MAVVYKEENISDNLVSAASSIVNTTANLVVLPVKLVAEGAYGLLSYLFTSEKQETKTVTINQSSNQSKQVQTQFFRTKYQIELLVKESFSLCLVSASSSASPPPDDDDNRNRIIAAIISTLLSGSGVCLILISVGPATPGMLLCSQMLINTGTFTFCKIK